MRNLSRMSFLLLLVAVLWIAGAIAFFVLRRARAGMLPLALPVGMLALGAAFLAVFFYFRQLTAERRPGKKRGNKHE